MKNIRNIQLQPHFRNYNDSIILSEFFKTRVEASPEDYFKVLQRLRPDRLSIEELIEIVHWIERTKKAQPFHGAHINVFGTGGDWTINISSMAAIIASHLTRVIKVGSPAVTSQVGSSDFFSELHSFLSSIAPTSQKQLMNFSPGSKFISLASLSFPYNSSLREARKRLKIEGIPDIYKVVFPFANYTNPRIQVNGVATIVYWDIFERLATKLKRAICIVHSEHEIDEAMPGHNRLLLISDTRRIETNWDFMLSDSNKVQTVFSEKDSPKHTVKLFEQIILGKAPTIITETIINNAALLVASHQLVDSVSLDFHHSLSQAKDDIKTFILQFREQYDI